jgi:predicted MFS family arabinose efflux permease
MTEPIAAWVEGERETLPVAALLALAMTGFTAILTETLPAGLLPRISQGLGVSESLAGQTVTAYAAGSLVAAIPLTAWTQGWRRKPTLLTAIIGFLIFNTITAMSESYWLTLVVRFLAGVAAGLAWGILAGYARRMVVDRLKGKALAIAMVGTPIALSLGVPAGAFFGATVGWRSAFFAMSGTTLILIGWVVWAVPDFAGQPSQQRLSIRAVFSTPGIRPILATIFAWMTAHNILYTYVAPFAVLSGLQGRVDLLLLSFGVAALVGIWVTGLLVDRMLRRLVLVSLIAFAAVALAFGLFATIPAVVIAGILLWGLSFGGAATQLQTASADAAGDGVDLANAMVTTVWNSAIAAGGLLGGLLLDHSGAGTFSWAVLALSLGALCIAFGARRYGFTPGPRALA